MAYPKKMKWTKTTTVEAACIDDISKRVDTKRKQSSAVFDNARLAARRMIRAASSTTMKHVRKRTSSNAMTRIQNVRSNSSTFLVIKVYFLVNINVDLRTMTLRYAAKDVRNRYDE